MHDFQHYLLTFLSYGPCKVPFLLCPVWLPWTCIILLMLSYCELNAHPSFTWWSIPERRETQKSVSPISLSSSSISIILILLLWLQGQYCPIALLLFSISFGSLTTPLNYTSYHTRTHTHTYSPKHFPGFCSWSIFYHLVNTFSLGKFIHSNM